MKEPKWLYRLESRDPNNGLWYNIKGEKIAVLESLKEKLKIFLWNMMKDIM